MVDNGKRITVQTESADELGRERCAKITERLREQIESVDRAVTAAKADAVVLFKEMDRCMRRAKKIAEGFPEDGSEEWSKSVSRIMDALEKPSNIMRDLTSIGIMAGRCPIQKDGLEWLFGDDD